MRKEVLEAEMEKLTYLLQHVREYIDPNTVPRKFTAHKMMNWIDETLKRVSALTHADSSPIEKTEGDAHE